MLGDVQPELRVGALQTVDSRGERPHTGAGVLCFNHRETGLVVANPDEQADNGGDASADDTVANPTQYVGAGHFALPPNFSAVRIAPRPSRDRTTVVNVSVPVSFGISVTSGK